MSARAWCAALALALLARPAEAHIIASQLGDFYAGAVHPMTALEDVVLWVALGILAGLQAPGQARWLSAVFPVALVAGVGAGLLAGVPSLPVVDAVLMVVLGVMAAALVRLPAPVLCAVAAVVGLARGVANASGVGPATNVWLFVGGFALAGYVAVTLATGLAAAFRLGAPWRTVALRAGGSWIAAIGLMAGGYALAG